MMNTTLKYAMLMNIYSIYVRSFIVITVLCEILMDLHRMNDFSQVILVLRYI